MNFDHFGGPDMRGERKMLVDEEKEGVFATKACVLQDLYENTHHHTTSCVSHVQKCKSLLSPDCNEKKCATTSSFPPFCKSHMNITTCMKRGKEEASFVDEVSSSKQDESRV